MAWGGGKRCQGRLALKQDKMGFRNWKLQGSPGVKPRAGVAGVALLNLQGKEDHGFTAGLVCPRGSKATQGPLAAGTPPVCTLSEGPAQPQPLPARSGWRFPGNWPPWSSLQLVVVQIFSISVT